MGKQQRKKERELALLKLFSLNFNPDEVEEKKIFESFHDLEELKSYKNLKGTYSKEIIESYQNNKDEIIEIIKPFINSDWRYERMAPVERAILELATTEMGFVENPVPKEIAINEALDLTHKYAEDKSTKYINAILNQVANTLNGSTNS